MADASAKLKNYRQSPRKVRLVADLVRGKSVEHALALLSTLPKRASEPMAKVIRSAVSNARTKGVDTNNLIISHVDVGQGVVFKRFMPRARGRASAIRKKTSHITLAVSARSAKN